MDGQADADAGDGGPESMPVSYNTKEDGAAGRRGAGERIRIDRAGKGGQ